MALNTPAVVGWGSAPTRPASSQSTVALSLSPGHSLTGKRAYSNACDPAERPRARQDGPTEGSGGKAGTPRKGESRQGRRRTEAPTTLPPSRNRHRPRAGEGIAVGRRKEVRSSSVVKAQGKQCGEKGNAGREVHARGMGKRKWLREYVTGRAPTGGRRRRNTRGNSTVAAPPPCCA